MSKKPTFNDFQEATQSELKKTYKMNDRQLEKSLRDQLYGGNQAQMRKEYNNFYRRKK